MTAICPAPGCGTEVLEARSPAGSMIILNPKSSQAGKYAAYEDEDGWQARLLTSAAPLREHERRYTGHTCKKLDPLRQAQAASAAAARTRRGQRKPRDRSPLAAAHGIRIPAPGDAR